MTKFHLRADDNSPIWGTAEDVLEWLEAWHAAGCPMRSQEFHYSVRKPAPPIRSKPVKTEAPLPAPKPESVIVDIPAPPPSPIPTPEPVPVQISNPAPKPSPTPAPKPKPIVIEKPSPAPIQKPATLEQKKKIVTLWELGRDHEFIANAVGVSLHEVTEAINKSYMRQARAGKD